MCHLPHASQRHVSRSQVASGESGAYAGDRAGGSDTGRKDPLMSHKRQIFPRHTSREIPQSKDE